MKIYDVEQRSEEWLELREGKITGTRLGDLYSPRGGRKIAFYETISELLTPGRDNENRMDRGIRLEPEALAKLSALLNKEPYLAGLCVSDVDERIANSPDALFETKGKYLDAAEIKCLSPARHLQAVIENKVPKEFDSQVIQYFVVNEDLERLHVVFYDPDSPFAEFWKITITREELGDKVQMFLDWQLNTLKEMDEIVERMSF